MFHLLTSKIGRFLAAIAAGIVFIFGLISFGKNQRRKEEKVERMEDYIETKKDLQDVEESTDRNAAYKRLRKNGWLG